ncbi:MAG: hypothetical protein O3A82_16455 [Verrucomicrobia bacterium]|nr:hypothetical protein [Verrucomicrobiota bacterium]MDA1048503.1 hypothetical protein [Verrucomicrobiota bacterium]
MLILLCPGVSGIVAAPPTLKIGHVPSGELAVFRKQFTYYLNVFGTATTPPAKLRHAAVILAEYLDNDEDGKPDNPKVLATMIQRNAFLFMTANERALGRLDHDVFQDAGFHHGQGQFATEINPGAIRREPGSPTTIEPATTGANAPSTSIGLSLPCGEPKTLFVAERILVESGVSIIAS